MPAVLTALDAVGGNAATLTADVVAAQVHAALTALGAPMAAPAAARDPGSQHLLLETAAANSLVWLGMLALTWAIGLFVLVLNNPGFGVPMDFLYCLIWGFGLPAAGQQLTGTSAATAIGITLPTVRA